MHYFADYGLFFAETLTILLAVLIAFFMLLGLAVKGKLRGKERLQVTKLNDKYQEFQAILKHTTLNKAAFKKWAKAHKQASEKQTKTTRKKIYVLHFIGDIRASGVKQLREEITSLLMVATPQDEVVLCLESPGGLVHGYGLAASQLTRLRQHQIPLTVIIDKVAASGGYLMASVANRIYAAPFAIVGSIGVIAQLPNFNRFLKKHDIDFEQVTAGEYKRTLTLFGKNTEAGREKFQQEINEVHQLFKHFVLQYRPKLDMAKVATGEHWYGHQALELNLIDKLTTSDDYLLNASETADIYEISYLSKKTLADKLSGATEKAMDTIRETGTN